MKKRVDYNIWGIPGGIMEIGETFEETVKREVFRKPISKIINFHFSEYTQGKILYHNMLMVIKYSV
ncbi:NUDIX domain-containing protein, partial [Bacillus sp. JJ722]|uniref:NUDIX domain-containing protein n=1 Tax=Bacillus sp. JJ722 TaxID=3122973 RepID=UPI0030005028